MIEVIKATEHPISFMGKVAGYCWGADTKDETKNYKRGIECIQNNHGRVMEFSDVTIVLSEYSARVAREIYTHIIGTSRLQESTRYVNCEKFEYFTPSKIENNLNAKEIYDALMSDIGYAYGELAAEGIPKEDIANILPLGMDTKITLKINVRAILNMAEVRTCTRAYHEFRKFMQELKNVLSQLDEEWAEIMNKYAVTKCVKCGFCNEKYSCGRYPKKEDLGFDKIMSVINNELNVLSNETDGGDLTKDETMDTVREVLKRYLKL
jgi:thymidylate synthase (FAD)